MACGSAVEFARFAVGCAQCVEGGATTCEIEVAEADMLGVCHLDSVLLVGVVISGVCRRNIGGSSLGVYNLFAWSCLWP